VRAVAALLLSTVVGCPAAQKPLAVELVDPANPPQFRVSGTRGRSVSFTVLGPFASVAEAEATVKKRPVVSTLEALDREAQAATLPAIRYGEIPAGLRATVWDDKLGRSLDATAPAAPLEVGKVYRALVSAIEVTAGHRAFLEASICFEVHANDVARVPCGK